MCAAGWLQGVGHIPPSERCHWRNTRGETSQAFPSLNLPLRAQWDFVKWCPSILLGSEADFLIASELSLTGKVFYPEEGRKPGTWGVCVLFVWVRGLVFFFVFFLVEVAQMS